jgi:hypothetical protein
MRRVIRNQIHAIPSPLLPRVQYECRQKKIQAVVEVSVALLTAHVYDAIFVISSE